jgi:hypothetical protein
MFLIEYYLVKKKKRIKKDQEIVKIKDGLTGLS